MVNRELFRVSRCSLLVEVHDARGDGQILEDVNYLNYRLAGVERLPGGDGQPELVWEKDEQEKDIIYREGKVTLLGEWHEGEIQKIIVSFMAKKMFELDLFLFHVSAVHYRGKSVMFLGGESNAGKTMSQIEASRRGASIIATETLVTEKDGTVVMGSKNVFLRQRAKGTERVDKPSQDEGVEIFFSKVPEFKFYEGETGIDLVIVPDIDGNYSTMCAKMSDFEKQYQTFHCLSSYLGLHLLLAPEVPMPNFDSEALRKKRALFIKDFSFRPYYFIRAKNPQIVLDELDKILG